MAGSMERWYQAAQRRYSVRAYSAGPEEGQLEALRQMAEALSARGVRIFVGEDDDIFSGLLGSKIKGTKAFAAFISQGAAPSAVGYIGEAFILECAAMGLDTCWLGMNFSRAAAMSAAGVQKGEKLEIVTPIGISAGSYIERPRHSLEELCELTKKEIEMLPEWKRCALECARRAPSAINAQPWSFDAYGRGIEVERISSNFGYGKLDCGIAMLHIELGAGHCGVAGDWKENGDRAVFLPNNV